MLRVFEYLNMLLTARNAIRSGAALVLVACFLWIVFGPTTADHSSSSSTKAPVVEAIRVPNKQKISTVGSANSTDQSPLPIVDTAALEQKIAFANEMKALRADAYRERVQLLVSDLTRLVDGLASWTQRVADLSTNDSGRRIVTNAQDFPAVVKLLGASLVADSELEMLGREVKLIERSAAQNGKSEPSSEMLAAVERSTKQIDAIHKTIERFSTSAGQFEKQSLSFELANMTLGEAIKKNENESSMGWAKKLASMDRENNARVEKESAQIATAKANAEIVKRAAIAEGELRQIEADAVAATIVRFAAHIQSTSAECQIRAKSTQSDLHTSSWRSIRNYWWTRACWPNSGRLSQHVGRHVNLVSKMPSIVPVELEKSPVIYCVISNIAQRGRLLSERGQHLCLQPHRNSADLMKSSDGSPNGSNGRRRGTKRSSKPASKWITIRHRSYEVLEQLSVPNRGRWKIRDTEPAPEGTILRRTAG